jgi:hypothetical protein
MVAIPLRGHFLAPSGDAFGPLAEQCASPIQQENSDSTAFQAVAVIPVLPLGEFWIGPLWSVILRWINQHPQDRL